MSEYGKSDLIDIACEIRGETDKAVRIFDGTKSVWLPKSQCEVNDDGTVTMSFWLAKEKELV